MVWNVNLQQVIDTTHILQTRFVDGKGECDVEMIIEEEIDPMEPFDLEVGPLGRFGVQGNILTGCIHHSIGDGRSIEILGHQLLYKDAPIPQ